MDLRARNFRAAVPRDWLYKDRKKISVIISNRVVRFYLLRWFFLCLCIEGFWGSDASLAGMLYNASGSVATLHIGSRKNGPVQYAGNELFQLCDYSTDFCCVSLHLYALRMINGSSLGNQNNGILLLADSEVRLQMKHHKLAS